MYRYNWNSDDKISNNIAYDIYLYVGSIML